MKKVLIGILTLVMVLGLVGCSSMFDESELDNLIDGFNNVKPYYMGTYIEDDLQTLPEYVSCVWVANEVDDMEATRAFLAIYKEEYDGEVHYCLRIFFNYQDSSVRLKPILAFEEIQIKTDNNSWNYMIYDNGNLGTNFLNGGNSVEPRVFAKRQLLEEDKTMIENMVNSSSITITSGDISWECTSAEIADMKKVYDAYIKATPDGAIDSTLH